MSSISSDTSAQLYLLRDAYLALRAKDPDNSLLALAELHRDQGGFDFTREYLRRCIRDDDRWKVQGYARYTSALEAAVNGDEVRLLDTDPACDF